jgi:hypothetical protein
MDVNRVSQGQRIAGIAGLLLFIDLWMSWYSVDLRAITGASSSAIAASGVDTTASAWQAFSWTDLLLALTALIAIGAAVATAARQELPIKLTPIIAPLAGVMTLLVLYRIVNQPGPNKLINVEWGAYLGLVLVAAVAYGGFRATSETTDYVAPAAPAPAA